MTWGDAGGAGQWLEVVEFMGRIYFRNLLIGNGGAALRQWY
jgi:hypothetical protein